VWRLAAFECALQSAQSLPGRCCVGPFIVFSLGPRPRGSGQWAGDASR